MTYKDEIVDEVRRIRDKYAAKFDYDIAAICQDIRLKQSQGTRKVVSRSDTKSKTVKAASGKGKKAA